jgi:transcription antitermination protein NusB
MKTSKDPRHIERAKVMQELFSYNFSKENSPEHKKTEEVLEHLDQIDKLINEAAPQWPIEKVNKIDLAILRLAIFELMIEKNHPPKVVVDEAVELAKEYGSESSKGFINGALGKLTSSYNLLS